MAIEITPIAGDHVQVITELDTTSEVETGGENIAVVTTESETAVAVGTRYRIEVFADNEIVQTSQVVETEHIEHLISE